MSYRHIHGVSLVDLSKITPVRITGNVKSLNISETISAAAALFVLLLLAELVQVNQPSWLGLTIGLLLLALIAVFASLPLPGSK